VLMVYLLAATKQTKCQTDSNRINFLLKIATEGSKWCSLLIKWVRYIMPRVSIDQVTNSNVKLCRTNTRGSKTNCRQRSNTSTFWKRTRS
jgi:hypothetical protein